VRELSSLEGYKSALRDALKHWKLLSYVYRHASAPQKNVSARERRASRGELSLGRKEGLPNDRQKRAHARETHGRLTRARRRVGGAGFEKTGRCGVDYGGGGKRLQENQTRAVRERKREGTGAGGGRWRRAAGAQISK